MKIVSKRGKKPQVEVNELDIQLEPSGIIIISSPRMTPEETKRVEEALRELRKQLDELGNTLDTGWYGS